MREERSRSRRLHGRAAAREAVVPHTVAVKCKNCGRVTTTALPVRAVFPTSTCPFKVCSLSCGLLFHGSWKMVEAEAMEQPGAGQGGDEVVAKYSGRWAQTEEIPDNADERERAIRLYGYKVLDVD